MQKPKNKHERNAAKALARSKRNSPPQAKKTSPSKDRRAERLAGNAPEGLTFEELEHKTVPELRTLALRRDLKVTTKLRKAELIKRLVGR